jgi:para-nitrobenzyl esterase
MTTIQTRLGEVSGKELGGVEAFLGIRYGRAPSGDLRFKPSQAEEAWGDTTYDATDFRHSAMQPPPIDFFSGHSVRLNAEPSYDEDCLFLNIYTPAADKKERPVLYWIHGGSYVSGSGYEYDGRVLAAQGDAVVVTINYRLGLLGFMDFSEFGDEYLGSASNGIGDQILGLERVSPRVRARSTGFWRRPAPTGSTIARSPTAATRRPPRPRRFRRPLPVTLRLV